MTDAIRTLESLELVGGSPCLDFVNTINSRHWPEHDYLTSYQNLVAWAGKAGILRGDEARQLITHANLSTAEAEAAHKKALSLRDLLYQLFSLLARHVEPEAAALAKFNALYAEAVSHGKLVRSEHGYTPVWDFAHSCEAVLYPVTYSAGALVLSDAQTYQGVPRLRLAVLGYVEEPDAALVQYEHVWGAVEDEAVSRQAAHDLELLPRFTKRGNRWPNKRLQRTLSRKLNAGRSTGSS